MRPADVPYYTVSTAISRAQESDHNWPYVGCGEGKPRVLLMQQCRGISSVTGLVVLHNCCIWADFFCGGKHATRFDMRQGISGRHHVRAYWRRSCGRQCGGGVVIAGSLRSSEARIPEIEN